MKLWRLIGLACVMVVLGACQQPIEIPPEFPGARTAPNPDFLAGSIWENESTTGILREFALLPMSGVRVTIQGSANSAGNRIPGLTDGIYQLSMALPAAGQQLLNGYPIAITNAHAILFTDNAASPTTAEIAVLIPDSRLKPQYFVLLGSYIKGVDTMEWELLVPAETKHGVELVPAPAALSQGELVFRRKKISLP